MKIGATCYHAFVCDDDGKVEIWTYIYRSKRGNVGYLVLKDSFTWGKLSKRHGHYGFFKYIPRWCRTTFLISEGLPSGYGLTKKAAIRSALAHARKWKHTDEIEPLKKRLARA